MSNILLNSRKNTLDNKGVLEQNKKFWDNTANKWVGVTALPTLGCLMPSEEDLHLFGDVSGKKVLDIGCGSGHSLKYLGDHNASELWGLDMSTQQIENTSRYLKDCGYEAHLFNSPWKRIQVYQMVILILFIQYMQSAGLPIYKKHLI
ncbi:class I SAM-dependent methyltransferase [Paenibacillus foliorum]|uniref:class I SAM-dependent methyltransferase n=1 Tax=Paenibacillus foliorum TaxID=2654974 RepID=UPI0028A8EE77|nr:class I SAM-dependent methyltransferase [Paenibacillus foliorum]